MDGVQLGRRRLDISSRAVLEALASSASSRWLTKLVVFVKRPSQLSPGARDRKAVLRPSE